MTATFDSSAWVELFSASMNADKIKAITSTKEIIYTSTVSLLEVKIFCERIGRDSKQPIEFIKKRSKVVPADAEICLLAADQRTRHKLHTVDAIIYATALQTESTLYTRDGHFENAAGVEMI